MATPRTSNPARKTAGVSHAAFLSATSPPPNSATVRDELIVFWDAFSPLSPAGIRKAYDIDASLEDIGIPEDDAMNFINKYNSIILRGPGKGPLVKTAEARSWATAPMPDIVKAVSQRAQP